jgi:hypothetical protein
MGTVAGVTPYSGRLEIDYRQGKFSPLLDDHTAYGTPSTSYTLVTGALPSEVKAEEA